MFNQYEIESSISSENSFHFHRRDFFLQHKENYYSHRQWHSFPIELNEISFDELNILATKKFDQYQIQRLDVSFENAEIVQLDSKNVLIEEATIDAEKGLDNAWILIVKPLIENLCLEKAKEVRREKSK